METVEWYLKRLGHMRAVYDLLAVRAETAREKGDYYSFWAGLEMMQEVTAREAVLLEKMQEVTAREAVLLEKIGKITVEGVRND